MHRPPSPWGAHTLRSAGSHRAARGRDFPPHQHEQAWELVYYREGQVRCPVGDAVYDAYPGLLLLTPPKTRHAEFTVTGYANYFMCFDFAEAPAWPLSCSDDANRTLEGVMGAIAREWSGAAADKWELLELLVGQLDLLMRRAGAAQEVGAAERLVRRAEALLAERLAAPVTIADIAREVGVSPSSLRAYFARLRDRSPLETLQALRLRRALALIQDSSLTLEAVARLSGYHSSSHLSRHIKRATNQRPGAYRPIL